MTDTIVVNDGSYSVAVSTYQEIIKPDISIVVIEGSGGGTGGLSAYEIAVNNGFVGTEQQWLTSLSNGGVVTVLVEFGSQVNVSAGLVEITATCNAGGLPLLNAAINFELLITDSAGEYEPSSTTVFLVPSVQIGQTLSGATTARLTCCTDNNAQVKIALYEPTSTIKYLWLKASGHNQYLLVAKYGIKEIFF